MGKEYMRCNKGHLLQPCYNERTRKSELDCPICKARMERERESGGKVSHHHKPKPRGYSMFNDKTIRRLG